MAAASGLPVSLGQDCDAGLRQVFDRAFAPVHQFIEAGRIPGGVLGMVDLEHGRIRAATGLAARLPESRPMRLDTWFDLASLTKVLFTTPRILSLAAAGRIELDAPLASTIPDLRQYDLNAWERKVTFRQCLGHQTPFPAVEPIFTYGGDPHLLRHFILQRSWPAGPSSYSDINFILLGIALERIEGRPLREQDPGPGFGFSAPPEMAAATEYCAWRQRILCGEVHDENCAALAGAGNAGLFGTIEAILDQAEDWLRKGRTGDPIVGLMRQPLSPTRTHGWERPHIGWSGGDGAGAATIGHTGFTGTGLWLDFDRGRAWSLLTNRVHPGRHADSGIFALRRLVGDAVSATA